MRLSFVLSSFLLLVSTSLQQAWAQVVAPSKGGDVSITQVSATGMVLKVGTTGTGQGRIVAIATTKAGTPVAMAPVDNQFYNGSSMFGKGTPLGSGFVVYSGTEHSVTVTGLQPNTYYYISSAEYNAQDTAVAYNTKGTNMIMPTRKASAADPAPLPVQLIAFTGAVDAHSLATLSWTTASEYNSAYFAVERSTDGVTFTEVGQMEAAGNSSQSLNYRWPDPQPLTASTYYRLRQVDRTITTAYSNVITLSPAPSVMQSVEIFPNPGTAQSIQAAIQGYDSETFTIQLTDALGRNVFNSTISPTNGAHIVQLGLPNTLATGSYLCTLRGSSTVLHKRIDIQ